MHCSKLIYFSKFKHFWWRSFCKVVDGTFRPEIREIYNGLLLLLPWQLRYYQVSLFTWHCDTATEKLCFFWKRGPSFSARGHYSLRLRLRPVNYAPEYMVFLGIPYLPVNLTSYKLKILANTHTMTVLFCVHHNIKNFYVFWIQDLIYFLLSAVFLIHNLKSWPKIAIFKVSLNNEKQEQKRQKFQKNFRVHQQNKVGSLTLHVGNSINYFACVRTRQMHLLCTEVLIPEKDFKVTFNQKVNIHNCVHGERRGYISENVQNWMFAKATI